MHRDSVKAFETAKLEFYQSRILLVSLPSIFDAALLDFNQHLRKKGSLNPLYMSSNTGSSEKNWEKRNMLRVRVGFR